MGGGQEPVVRFLVGEGVDMEVKDNSGKTLLQVALDKGFGNILDILLWGGGAKIGGLGVDKLPGLRWSYRLFWHERIFGSGGDDGLLILMVCGDGHIHISKRTWDSNTEIHDLLDWYWSPPSICLIRWVLFCYFYVS